MSETVWIVLIIAITVIVVLYLFRRRLSEFFFKASQEGLEASLKTHDSTEKTSSRSHGVQISGNRLVGVENEIKVEQDDVGVDDNVLLGKKQKISVEAKKKNK